MATSRASPAASPTDPGSPHLILVGLPGAGKSTVGALVAEGLQRAFLDFDAEIVRRYQRPVAQIFAEQGEAEFRRIERALTEELRELGGMVLSPGGGWMSSPDVVALLRPPAVLIYLRVSPATALTRLGGAAGRPLLGGPDPLGALESLLAMRRAGYESADVEIDTERLTPQQVTAKLLAWLRGLDRGPGATPLAPLA